MVFTCAVPLAQLEGVEPRLVSRLEGGLVVNLPPPEREVRLTVVERMLRDEVGEVDTELAGYLASRHSDSVRSLHGIVQRVVTAAAAKHSRPTATLARELLEASPPTGRQRRAIRVSGVVALPGGRPAEPGEDHLGLARAG